MNIVLLALARVWPRSSVGRAAVIKYGGRGHVFFLVRSAISFLTNAQWETDWFTKHFNIHCRVNSLSRHFEHKREECHFIVKYKRQTNPNGGDGEK